MANQTKSDYPERIVPDETESGIVALHLKRYAFALPWCENKRVIDGACGVGYGSAFLGTHAAHVLGVDASEEAIAYARHRYSGPNVDFACMDLLALDVAHGSYDVVCSFETIEHLADCDSFLSEVVRVLDASGMLLVSTPRADETTHSPANPFHKVEFSRVDFERLLRQYFGTVELHGQRRVQTARHRLLQRLDVLGLRKRLTFLRPAARLLGTPSMADLTADDLVISRDDLDRATELLAVCGEPRRS